VTVSNTRQEYNRLGRNVVNVEGKPYWLKPKTYPQQHGRWKDFFPRGMAR